MHSTQTVTCDVAVYNNGSYLECVRCLLTPEPRSLSFLKYSEILAHLRQHRLSGHKVPDTLYARLQRLMVVAGDMVNLDKMRWRPDFRRIAR